MKCPRCRAKMLPSQRACSYCSSISDAELSAFAAHTLSARGIAHLLGLGMVVTGLVLLAVAIPVLGLSLLAGGGMALTGVVIGAGGAERIESGKLYARLKHIDRFRRLNAESQRALNQAD